MEFLSFCLRHDELIKDSEHLNVPLNVLHGASQEGFFFLTEKGYCSLAYLDILALKSVRQIEGHRWEKLCESV